MAKILKLVAPVSMDDHAQVAWITSAVDALDGIQPSEVAAISAEIRRSVTRHNQIVPEIARLVAERRKRPTNVDDGPCRCGKGTGPFAGRTDIHWIRLDGRPQIETCRPA